jgi:TRAP-type mannitol/chloroaromatic compound transport system permease small subunit
MKSILPSIAKLLSQIPLFTGQMVSWFSAIMVLLLTINVLSSWLFKSSSILVSESITWMHSANFLLAAAYTLNRGEHVRVDIFYTKMSLRGKAVVDLLGTLLLLLPVSLFIIWSSWSYVRLSWRIGEVSAEAGGMPYTFILKAFLILMPLLLIIEAINQLCISIKRLTSATESNVSKGAN